MATKRGAALLALAILGYGCQTNRCRNQTLLVSVTLDAKSAAADHLEVDVSVAGSVRHSALAHTPGSTSGTIEVRFPSGYPSGKSVVITIVATRNGETLGSAMEMLMLQAGCATTTLTVMSGGVGLADLASGDLTGMRGDMTGMSQDLSGVLADMCPTQTENCFNGVDDNCDGLIDCADPQCTGGASPVAECVPDPGSAVAGTLSSTSCGASYPTSTAIFSGLVAGDCGTGSCSCGQGVNGSVTCNSSLTDEGGTQLGCNVFHSPLWSKTNVDGCFTMPGGPLSSSEYYNVSKPALTGACYPPTGGLAAKIAPTWTNSYSFCSGVSGGGCMNGQICVPAAPKHCVLMTGMQVACNVSGYSVQDSTPYFSGFDDSSRMCNCACNLGGSCGAVTMGPSMCNLLVGSGCQNGLSYAVAQIAAPNNPGCNAVGVLNGGATSTTGYERTVCCTK
jgi:hypothetical protein